MLDLKNIYSEIIEDIRNMTDEQMIDEMVSAGCIFIGRTRDFEVDMKYSINEKFTEVFISKSDKDYSNYKGVIAA
jgi:hypothetical protein